MIPLRDDNPIRSTPVVTIALITLCAIVFLWEITLSPDEAQAAVYLLGFVPAVLFGRAEPPEHWVPPGLSIFTAMFMHSGLMHLIGNMLYLWIFGDNVEDRVGHVRFVFFYLLCGAVAAFAQALPDMGSRVPMIGASGAVSGVLGAYIVLYPRANVLVGVPVFLVFQTFRVPAWVVLGMWFIGQLLSSLMAAQGQGGVAFGAHVGGFLAGVVLIRPFLRERRTSRH
jgi:membrane associated rhomboid family serine protease